MYLKSFVAGWGVLDVDGRFRSSSCLVLSNDVRMVFFAEHGFSFAIFRKHRLTPPTPQLVDILQKLPMSSDYQIISGAVK